jgi:hypothetical protein
MRVLLVTNKVSWANRSPIPKKLMVMRVSLFLRPGKNYTRLDECLFTVTRLLCLR